MNGSLGYGPAFAAMLIIGGWLALKRHKAATLMLAATAAFAVSLTLRSLDQQLCGQWIVMGHRMGTHFLWHLFNSLTLFLLLVAAIRHGGGQEVLPPRPKAKPPVYVDLIGRHSFAVPPQALPATPRSRRYALARGGE